MHMGICNCHTVFSLEHTFQFNSNNMPTTHPFSQHFSNIPNTSHKPLQDDTKRLHCLNAGLQRNHQLDTFQFGDCIQSIHSNHNHTVFNNRCLLKRLNNSFHKPVH